MSHEPTPPGSAGRNSPADAPDAREELAFCLLRAGIHLSPDRFEQVLAEYLSFRPHLDLIRRSVLRDDEPALALVTRRPEEAP